MAKFQYLTGKYEKQLHISHKNRVSVKIETQSVSILQEKANKNPAQM
jgi:hypothetical protein